MVDVQRTFLVRQTTGVVVDYLKDFARATEWDPGTDSCERTGGGGPIEVGTVWHNVSVFRGRKTELDYRLDICQPTHLRFIGVNKTATSVDDLTFTPAGPATSITYHAVITFNGLAKLAGPFLQREFERLGDQVQRQMTTVLEAL